QVIVSRMLVPLRASRIPLRAELTSAGLEGRTSVCLADLATGPAWVGRAVAGAEIIGPDMAGGWAQAREERAWPMEVALTVTRTMTTTATAVMGTDRMDMDTDPTMDTGQITDTDHTEMDTERIRMDRMRVHTVSGGDAVNRIEADRTAYR